MNVFAGIAAAMLILTSAAPVGTLGRAVEGVAESRYEQSEIGCAVADAVRLSTDADAALVYAGEIQNGLSGLPLSQSDVEAVFSQDEEICVADVSAQTLYDIVEHGCSHVVLDKETYIDPEPSAWDGFLQISGISYVFDVTAPEGSRITKLCLNDETLPKDNTMLKVAAPKSLFDGALSYPEIKHQATGITLSEALADAISKEHVNTSPDTRIRAIGCRDDAIISYIGRGPLAVIMVIGMIIIVVGKKTHLRSWATFETQ